MIPLTLTLIKKVRSEGIALFGSATVWADRMPYSSSNERCEGGSKRRYSENVQGMNFLSSSQVQGCCVEGAVKGWIEESRAPFSGLPSLDTFEEREIMSGRSVSLRVWILLSFFITVNEMACSEDGGCFDNGGCSMLI